MTDRTSVADCIEHRIAFPKRDVREVVRLSDRTLKMQCSTLSRRLNRRKVSALSRRANKFTSMELPQLRQKLKSSGFSCCESFSHCAACIALAEYELECCHKSAAEPGDEDHFQLENESGDMLERTIPGPGPGPGPGTGTGSGTGTGTKRRRSSCETASASNPVPSLVLDTHQREAVEMAKSAGLTMINAGPGTGKTTTLCILVRELIESNPSVKILFLSFSTKAEDVMKSRIKSMGLGEYIVPKQALYYTPGVCILTFDKYAYTLNNTLCESYSMGKQESLVHLKAIVESGNKMLDYLLVDESQDLSLVEYQMMVEISKFSERTVLAGDPRQECFSGCSSFSNMWCTVKDGEASKVHLVNNYRSCPCIVRALNSYSAAHFPNIGGRVKQVSMVAKCSSSAGMGGCIQVIHCHNNWAIGDSMLKDVKEYSVNDVYMISPMSVLSYGNDVVTLSLHTKLIEMGKSAKKHPRTWTWTGTGTGTGTEPASKRATSSYIIKTAMTLKGGEAETVCLFGLDRCYHLDHFTRNRQLKLLYVAMSRAKSSLRIYMNNETPERTMLHRALEGCVLPKRAQSNGSEDKALHILTKTLEMRTECYGLNKENSGGLCSCNFETEVEREGSVGCSLVSDPSMRLDATSLYFFSKYLIREGMWAWMCKRCKSGKVGEVWEAAVDRVNVHLSSHKQCAWDKVKQILAEDLAAKREVEDSTLQFGFAAFSGILCACAFALGKSRMLSTDAVVDVFSVFGLAGYCPETATVAYRRLTELREVSDMLDFAANNIESDAKAYLSFGPTLGSGNAFVVTALADLLFTAESSSSKKDHISMPIVLCTKDKEMPKHLISRTSLCAAIFKSPYGMLLNCTTGSFLLCKATAIGNVKCVAKSSMLSKVISSNTMPGHLIPLHRIPSLCEAVSVAFVHAFRSPGKRSKETLCVALTSQFQLESSETWPMEVGDVQSQREATENLNRWVTERVRTESMLVVYTDSHTEQVLGDTARQEYSTPLHAVFADIAGQMRRANATVSTLLKTPKENTLDWCKDILADTCCSFPNQFGSYECQDTNVAAICVLKSLLNLDTSV